MGFRPRVLVMMATYAGERWVAEQLDSILAQDGVDVTLRICDDRSPDGTLGICRSYAERYPNVIVTQNERNLGVAENFMQMVYEEGADDYDYYAFSDQDDVWLPHKLLTGVNAIRDAGLSEEDPALYYSDLLNVGPAGESRELLRFAPCEKRPGTVLVRNYINGCVMLFNRPLLNLLRQYRPAEWPRIHDCWIHMVARFCGTVVCGSDQVLMRRRLSGDNLVGETQLESRTPSDVMHTIALALTPPEHACGRCAQMFWDAYANQVKPGMRGGLQQFLAYRETLRNRIIISGSDWYWLPSPEARLRMKVAFLRGFY